LIARQIKAIRIAKEGSASACVQENDIPITSQYPSGMRIPHIVESVL